MNRMATITALGTLPLLAGCSLFGIRSGYESAAYEIIQEDGSFELRGYEALVVARTSTRATYDESGSASFRRLFGYIAGNNETGKGIAMTTPVFQEGPGSTKIAMTTPVIEKRSGDEWTMAFVVPAEYTLESAPKPTDPDVSLAEIPPRKVAVVRYSGFLSEEKLRDQTVRLLEWIDANGLTPVSGPRSAGYDPPWTIPFLRRNEVLIEVASGARDRWHAVRRSMRVPTAMVEVVLIDEG